MASTTPDIVRKTIGEIADSLVGYIAVAPDMWAMIPVGSHIRYERKFTATGDASKSARTSKAVKATMMASSADPANIGDVAPDLFRMGGFVTNRTTINGKHLIWIENQPGVNRRTYAAGRGQGQGHGAQPATPPGYSRWSVDLSEISRIWKKLAADAFIELTLIQSSLIQKQEQIAALQAQVDELSALIRHVQRPSASSRPLPSLRR